MTEEELTSKYIQILEEYERKNLKELIRNRMSALLNEVQKRIEAGYGADIFIEAKKNVHNLTKNYGVNESGVFEYEKLDTSLERYFQELLEKFFLIEVFEKNVFLLTLKIPE